MGIYAESSVWQTESISLDSSNSGTSKILVFTWVNSNSWGEYQPPISIDNVELTSNYAVNELQAVVVGDSVELKVYGHTGLVQWQQCNDSSSWIDISGYTHATERFVATWSPTFKMFYRARISDSDCLPHTPTYSSIIRHKIIPAYSMLEVGDFYKGGVVYTTDGAGNGTVVPRRNQMDSVIWGELNVFLNASSHSDGIANTLNIVNGCSIRPIAASVCYDLAMAHYNDWYLPAHDQLLQLYTQSSIIGGFEDARPCWSSTEISYSQAYTQQGELLSYKTDLYNIRCVRNFTSTQKMVYSYVWAPAQYTTIQYVLQPQSHSLCAGENVSLSVGVSGTSPYTYQWYKDGLLLNGATNSVLSLNNVQSSEGGIYTCESSNTCRTIISDPANLKVIVLNVNSGVDSRICKGANSQINITSSSSYPVISGVLSYSWMPITGLSSGSVANPLANPVQSTTYAVTLIDQLGCTATDSLTLTVGVPFENEEICLVTVDQTSGKNKVIWDKTLNVGTQYYLIYKETGANDFTNVGNVNYTQPGEFIDVFSQPQSYSNRYKISCLDTCNNESQLSFFHKTINLTLSSNGSTMGLQWNDYIEESGSFIPSWFYIYRGINPSSMVVIDSVSGGLGSYNDMNIFDVYYYKVGVKRTSGCGNSKSIIWAYSNQKNNSSLLGIEDVTMGSMNISPNPFYESTTILIPNVQILNNNSKILISDVTGKIVRTINISNYNIKQSCIQIEIDRGDLKPGIYFVELSGNRVYRGKLIVE